MKVPRLALLAFLVAPSTVGAFSVISRPHSCVQRRRQRFVLQSSTLDREETTTKPTVEETTPRDSSVTEQKSEFVNDGLFSWMTPYLNLFGIQEGKSVWFGPIPVDIDTSNQPSMEQAAQLRKEAADNLMNIGMDERERRAQASNVFAVLTAVYMTVSTLALDHGDLNGHLLRFMSVIPLFFTTGYKLSADTGL